MSAIERGLYVWLGAADLAVEKVGESAVVQKLRERTRHLGEKSIIDRAREIEPRLRDRAGELSTRGEKVAKRLREEAKQVQSQLKSFPEDARKQLKDFPTTARKQVDEVRGRIQKVIARDGNGTASKPAAAKAEATKRVS